MNSKIKTFPCAKINLGLSVVSRRDDGYHNLETIFYPVALHDVLEVTESNGSGCTLTVNGAEVGCEAEKNLVVRAYNQLREKHSLPGVHATLTKRLPMQAGMGGGSSDGAYMIKALNEMFSLNMSKEEMRAEAARIGADCPFFIDSKPAYATGIGDVLKPCDIPQLRGKTLILVKPNAAVSTKEAYAGITPRKPLCNCLEAIKAPIETWRETLINDFEDSVFPKLPVLTEVKETLYARGALYAAMTGSGSTIYGIYNEEPETRDLREKYETYKLKID